MSYLIVPINVRAIWQSENKAVVGPEMDFESMPYFDKKTKLDVNPDKPFLAESIVPKPFEDCNFVLRKGVHLNWDLPNFLKTTKVGASKPTDLPAVPTRWLISRYINEEVDKQWIVESDSLLQNLNGFNIADMAQTSIHVDIHKGERPYTYMGRIEELDKWKNRNGNVGHAYTDWKSKHQGQPLTAMGWGSPSFDTFYPNCRGVFGFHDQEMESVDDTLSYKVVGWYGDSDDDYWTFYLDKKKLKKTDQDTLEDQNEINDLKEINDRLVKAAHLTDEQKIDFAKSEIEKIIENDLGIEFNSFNPEFSGNTLHSGLPEDGMICGGTSVFIASAKLKSPIFAMGNTPTEALSAMIVGEKFKNANGPAKEKQEDTFEAILMGDRLKSLSIDIGPKFREYRHAGEFVSTKGGSIWSIRRIDDNKNKDLHGDPHHKTIEPALPSTIIPYLEDLNETQRQYDKAIHDLESRKTELYADWYRYMHCAYPPPGETEEYLELNIVKAKIKYGSLNRFINAKQRLGKLLDSSVEEPTDALLKVGLAGQVRTALFSLILHLDEINDSIPELAKFHWEVQHFPGPRFWEPSPPAVVMAVPKDPTIDHNGFENSLLPCEALDEELVLTPDGFSDMDLVESINSLSFPEFDSSQSIHYKAEWETEVFPVSSMHPKTHSSGIYDPNFVVNNYFLGENEPDLVDHSNLASPLGLTKTARTYKGSTYVKYNLGMRYEKLMDTFIELQKAKIKELVVSTTDKLWKSINKALKISDTDIKIQDDIKLKVKEVSYNNELDKDTLTSLQNEIKPLLSSDDASLLKLIDESFNDAWDTFEAKFSTLRPLVEQFEKAYEFLKDHDLYAITLNGFNSALLQMHESIQLNPADPLGFKDYQQFAKNIASALNDFKGFSPDPHSDFLPIRSGALRLLSLRFVDIFGRIQEFSPKIIHTSISMQVPNHDDWVRLPPRLSQAARFNFRFLQSQLDKNVESHDHEDSTPIYGWIVPNLLDHSLVFFHANGKKAGTIDQNGNWKAVQGGEETEALSNIKDWIGEDPDFIKAFIEGLEESMDNIHPNDRQGQSAFSVLMGRPMAIVRLGIELELKGLPAFNISWSEFRKDVGRNGRETDGFRDVKFPFRIGEYRQRNDGLIGYWSLSDNGKLSSSFNINDSLSASINDESITEEDEQNLTGWLKSKNDDWKIQETDGPSLFEYLRQEKDKMIKKQDLIQPYVREGSRLWEALMKKDCLSVERTDDRLRHYATAENLSIASTDYMQQFLCLMDPFGQVHLSSGIQPVKSIQLPTHFIKKALERIEISFLTAPILGPEPEVQISLPKEQAYTWRWEEKNVWLNNTDNKSTESTIIKEKDLSPFHTNANFPDRNVLREGYITLHHKKEDDANTDVKSNK